ncbi:MAG: bifunctional metallophosphatase/5'-nucleotidase [Bacteroidetes bacterium]|nr:bifunctional metallophosphatase/5'-nucleotidase [Bacteroidota bacterium]
MRLTYRTLFLLLLAVSLRAQTVELTILHYNDLHAQNVPTTLNMTVDGERQKVDVGGYAVLKAYVDRERGGRENVLLLHAGDDFQGTPISSITKGRSQFELLELMQPDVMTLGNHEFDHGADNLRQLFPTVSFPIVSANLWDKSRGTPFVPRYRMLRRAGMAIGVIGLAPPDLKTLTMRSNVADLDVLDAAMATRQAMHELQERFGVKFFVVLSHQGVQEDSVLAANVDGIDVIVGGHSHSLLRKPKNVNGALIVQAGSRSRWLGRLDLTVDSARGEVTKSWGKVIETVVKDVRPDPVMEAKVRELESVVETGLSEVIGELVTPWVRGRDGESNIGSWQADVMRDFAKTDIAFQNSGGIRKNLDAGPITLRDMWEISPFGNEFVVFSVTGAQLLSMMRFQAEETGEFCQVSGLRFSYDYDAPQDKALTVAVGGKPVDPEKTYTVTTNSYVGGMLHDVFGLPEAEIEVRPAGSAAVDRDVFIDYVREQKRIDSPADGRITLKGNRK